jgi:hypothetical protein
VLVKVAQKNKLLPGKPPLQMHQTWELTLICGEASLETLNFMPLAQVDPFGGVIVTDWYASAEAPNERFKANIYILDTNLRADALKASIFKQKRISGSWQDASIDADTARQIENAILTRARELYIATVDAQ